LKDNWTVSLEYAQRALAIVNTYSEDEEAKAHCLHAVGTALLEQQQFVEAVGYIQQVLDIRRRILPSLHPSLAVSYNDLGFAYKRQERYEEALLAYETCLEIRRRSLPDGHWAFAIIYNNLANILYQLYRNDKALEMSALAVETALQALGADHPMTDTCRTTFEGISATHEE
jgi:tetratricopeptide (TPR) repeat protein